MAGALGDPGYNVNANDTYIFTLQAFNNAGALLGSDTINVVAGKGATPIPEPVAVALWRGDFRDKRHTHTGRINLFGAPWQHNENGP